VGGRVLITRPEPGAAQTAKRLQALGFEPVCLPLTEIRPVPPELPAGRKFDAVAIPSANAIRHAPRPLLRAIAGLPVFAVGRRTAEAATEAGFAVPMFGPGYGQGLAALMAGRLASGARVLYLCGRVRTRGFEETLHAAGIEAIPVETYDTVVLDYTDKELKTALGGEAFDAVLVYSRVAAKTLAKLTDRSVMSRLLARAAFVCMSTRIAEPLMPIRGERVRVAVELDEDAMLARLAA
jgi:uroporphyrinogen-III synthase